MVDNPCVTLPVDEYWYADFTNSRCYKDEYVGSISNTLVASKSLYQTSGTVHTLVAQHNGTIMLRAYDVAADNTYDRMYVNGTTVINSYISCDCPRDARYTQSITKGETYTITAWTNNRHTSYFYVYYDVARTTKNFSEF